jgi:2-polyprenyl-6-methoxyphenol hydroxylase-like FAD-dependent oxidoreductase
MNPDILVVGAGPVGLTMAAELTRYGARPRIVDQAPRRSDKSKALVIWSRTMELIDRMECGDRFVAAGLQVKVANIIAGRHEVAHLRLDAAGTPHPYALMIPQSETERLLGEHLGSLGVAVERQVELLHFTQTADRVSATLRHPDGREETSEFAWVIGCDGAHSTVRHRLSLPFEGDTLPSDWILADLHLDGLRTAPDELDLYWHSDGLLALFPMSGGRYRVVADLGDADGEDHPADPTLQEVQALLDRRGPGGVAGSAPNWLSRFRINERKVADYRAGRVFVAGDAAHVHSPAGGQGMNTGMQDAFNLSWKLALVCRGLARADALLDTYSAERSPVARQVLRDTGRLTAVGVLRGGLAQAIRNHAASLLAGLSSVRRTMAETLTELSIGYPDSPLSRRVSHVRGGPDAGERAPVGDPVGTGDTPRFTLFAPPGPESAALIARHAALVEANPRPPFAADGIWLVRPDGYVALVAGLNGWSSAEEYLASLALK